MYSIYSYFYAEIKSSSQAPCSRKGEFSVIFSCSNLTKHVSEYTIEHISFEVQPGEIIGVMGTNGSGKSTLFHTITGVYRLQKREKDSDEGIVSLCGFDMELDQAQYRQNFYFVGQNLIYADRSKPIEVGEKYGKYYPDFQMEAYRNLLQEFHIKEDQIILELSDGEKMRMQLAFALAVKAPLLILDEPAANLDEEFRNRLYGKLREYTADEKHSVLIASHILDEMEAVADHILWLEREGKTGKVKYFGTMDDMKEMYRMVKKKPLSEERVIGGRESAGQSEYLIQTAGLSKEKITGMNANPVWGMRYASLTEILYYVTKKKIVKKGEHADDGSDPR